MILGLGIDIVSVSRIQEMLEKHGGRAMTRLYTEIEREYCDRLPHPALHYAARFAAKEAFVKALGTGFSAGVRWRDIGVVNDAKGKPELRLEGTAFEHMRSLGATRTLVSLTHDPSHAAAVVILE
jgi:holo-[acyl-carrier protein] synthase